MKSDERHCPESGARGLTPEDRLVIALAAGKPSFEDEAPPSSLNWDYIFAFLCHHGLAGFAHKRLEKCNLPVPATFRQALSREYWAIAASNLLLMDSLKSLFRDFSPSGHPLLLTQGAALLQTLYEDWGLRPMGDIDLLVWPEELKHLKRYLEARGLTPVADYPDKYMDGNSLLLDIHTHIADTGRIGARALTFPVDNVSLWEGAVPIEGSGGMLFALSPGDSLLAMSIHLVKHSFSHLMWAVDMLALLEKEEDNLDWPLLIEKARAWGVLRSLLFTLHFIRGRFGVRLPGALESLAGREPLNRLEKALLRSLKLRDPPELFGNLLLSHWAPGLRGKISLLWESCFPGDTVMKQVFPGYRPGLRPFFLFRRAVALSRSGLKEGVRLAKGSLF